MSNLSVQRTPVVIVGGGPAGLMLAIELGCRDVPCIVLEEDADVAVPPKANATSARTMEHYRRRGFAADVRAVGLTADHPQDVVYCTRLAGHELARFAIPSRDDVLQRRGFGDLDESAWPTPELPHRGSQMYIEPILRREARRWPSVTLRFESRVTQVRDLGTHVEVDVVGPEGPYTLQADHAVGCEGARSLVREAMGVRYLGLAGEQREFFGGQMLSLHIRAPRLYGVLGPRAWTWWLVNRERRGVLVAIDGRETFIFGIQLMPGETRESIDVQALFATVCGQPFDFELLDRATWTAGHMLVAERMQRGRLWLAGDSAHLFTPTGGMGYNTSVDDAVNLGWKLAALVQGWGGAQLADSYEAERRPIAERNTRFARRMAESIGRLQAPEALESEGDAGEASRREIGRRLREHACDEYRIPGIQLGLRYEGPVIAREPGAPPPDEDTRYVPSGYPGARAPHVALADGRSLLDAFGRDFTLLAFDAATGEGWARAARELGVPLSLLAWPDPASRDAARALYGADRVLVRPDHHIAWRGEAGADARAVLAHAVGLASSS